jgi:AraC-like DNA-binding protein
VQNFWLPIVIRNCVVGLAFVQAQAIPATGVPVRPIRRGLRTGAGASRQPNDGTKGTSEPTFGEAARLLRLVIDHVETSALADLRKAELTQAQRALGELQTVAARLRGELNRLVPAFNRSAPVLESDNHTDRVVRATLQCIHENYSEPITLKKQASALKLHPAYLSALFSRAVGMPFKTYLTEVRIEKARELLGAPAKTISETAAAVGFASENRFRIAFKKCTGLAPAVWRETLRMRSA